MFKSFIYDSTMRAVTARWYREVLKRLPDGARLLDVGIGTAGALADNAALVHRKKLRITGVDIDESYLTRAAARIADAGLSGNIRLELESVYTHQGEAYDAVYFSGSFMLLPDPVGALRHVVTLLKPGGRVYFTQTFLDKPSMLMEKAKPLLGKITSIEFGRVTYEKDFLETLEKSGMRLEEFKVMKTVGKNSYRLAIAAPGHKG